MPPLDPKDENELPGLDALDALDGAGETGESSSDKVADESALHAIEAREDADGEAEGEGAEGEAADPVFEALAAKDPAAAERYVEFLEKQKAAEADAEKPAAEVIDLKAEPDELGIDTAGEQEINAQSYRSQLVAQDQQFKANTVDKIFEKGQKLLEKHAKLTARKEAVARRYGADSDEAREITRDIDDDLTDVVAEYTEIKKGYDYAQGVRQKTAFALHLLDGVDKIVKAAPVLRRHRERIVKLVDEGKLDPYATSAEIKAVLKQHLPKAGAASAAKDGKPSPDKIKELRERLGSTKGSGGTSTPARDGAPRKPATPRASGKYAHHEEYYAKIRGTA